jgi:hypothetical protein
MPLGDKKRQLDEQVAAAVRRAVEELQQEVRSRLQEATESLQRSIGDITPRLPESFLLEADLRSMTEEAAAAARAETLALAQQSSGTEGRRESLAELRDAIRALDRAPSQSEVLQALLDESAPYASRVAIFLVRDGRALGWGSRGFGSDAAARGLAFEAATPPWSDLAADGQSGAGMRDLSAHESAAIASALESEVPVQAVALALVLRDRVAAVLYADQLGDGPLESAALQILTYTAANALESQPLRTRRSTATLVARSVAAATAAIPVEDYLAVAVPEPEEAEESAIEISSEGEPEFVAPPVVEPEPVPLVLAAEPEPEPELEWVTEVEPEPAAISFFTAPEPVAPVPELEPPAEPVVTAETEAWPLPPLSAPEPVAPEPMAAEPLPPMPSFDDVEISTDEAPAWADSGIDLEPAGLGAAPTMRYELQDLALHNPPPPVEPISIFEPPPPANEPEVPSLGGFADFALESDGALEILEEPPALPRPSLAWEEPEEELPASLVVAEPEPEPEIELPAEPLTPVAPAFPSMGADTVLVPTLPAMPLVEAAPEPPAPLLAAEPAGPVGGGQVAPPPDLEGPGWAFSTTSVPIAKGDEPSHEEARRLARLLVSEIQLYNQEEVEEGRRNRDLYERLKDDIDRSRQLYEERVDPAIRESTDYFYQELVRQLAAGDARALGI